MTTKNRVAAALLLTTAVLILLIAAGISDLELQPGQKFTMPLSEDSFDYARSRYNSGEGLLFLMRFLFAVAIVALPFFLLYSLFTPEGRRRLLALLFIMAFVFVIVTNRDDPAAVEPTPVPQITGTPEVFDYGEFGGLRDVVTEAPEEPPDWMLYAIVTGVALLFATLIVAVVWYYRKRAIENDLARLGIEMRQTIDTIEEGGDLGSSILTAYRDMSRVVRQTQGLERTGATTPHEFIQVLVGKGLPEQAVLDITQLFEQVRYGGKLASAYDEQRALDSLRAIAAACEEPSYGT
jgi:hypothetical protein